MATHKISKAIMGAYRRTAFEVDHPDGKFVIRVGETSEKLDAVLRRYGKKNWAYITAANPRSIQLSTEHNALRRFQLGAYLLAMGYTIFPGRGISCSPGWTPEESFLVLGISSERAERLGSMLAQNAIVVGRLGKPAALKLCKITSRSRIIGIGRSFLTRSEHARLYKLMVNYVNGHIEEIRKDFQHSGIWVRKSDVPNIIDPEDLDLLDGKVSSQRIAALKAGKKPNTAEVQLWRKAWIERALQDSNYAPVTAPAYFISEVPWIGKPTTCVLILARRDGMENPWFERFVMSPSAAKAYMAANGWLSDSA